MIIIIIILFHSINAIWPNNDRRHIQTETENDGKGFTKYAIEMGSYAMIRTHTNFVNIGSGIHKFIQGASQTHKQHSHETFFYNQIYRDGVNV
jgi:hypothetical protein